jgi:SAM-dependent methyltransferase
MEPKLSVLVHYRNLLKNYIIKDADKIVNDQIESTLHLINSHTVQFPELTKNLNDCSTELTQSFDKFVTATEEIYNKIQNLINEIEILYFKESYRVYQEEFIYGSTDYLLSRKLKIDQTTLDYIKNRIISHGIWQYPGMMIRPGAESWSEYLVACDPLYLVDTSKEMLEPTLNKFNEAYRNRLRCYYIKESTVDKILDHIPNGQFGFCLIYNFFNYKPIEILNAYLSEIFDKLRPGGTVAFTFNNCDRPEGIELVDNKFMCYTPQNKILSMSDQIGYQIFNILDINPACTWIELTKPGTLSSLRGGQSLARIVAKSK